MGSDLYKFVYYCLTFPVLYYMLCLHEVCSLFNENERKNTNVFSAYFIIFYNIKTKVIFSIFKGLILSFFLMLLDFFDFLLPN